MSINKVILVGNLGQDPEVRHLESGATVATFSVATSETYKDRNSGERKTMTEWHNVVLWRGLADVAEKYLKKGNQVYIEGKIQTRSWEDKDGNTRYRTEVIGNNMTMLGSRREESNSNYVQDPGPSEPPYSANTSSGSSNVESADNDVDDLPF